MSIPAHQKPIKTIAVMNMPTGPKVLTGSSDATVKVRKNDERLLSEMIQSITGVAWCDAMQGLG
jgi:hypothetical protein